MRLVGCMEIVVTAQAADLHLSKAGLDVGWYQLAKHKASHQRGQSSDLRILRTSAFLGWRRSCRIRSASRLLSSSSSLLASPADLCGPFPPTAECPAYMNLPFVVDSHHGIAQNLCVYAWHADMSNAIRKQIWFCA